MYCLNCGTQMSDTAKFCHACGAVVQRAEVFPPDTPYAPYEEGRRRGPSRRLMGCLAVVMGVVVLLGLVLIAAYFILGLHRGTDITELAPEDAAAVVVIRPSLLQLNQMRDTDRLAGAAAAFAPLAFAPGVTDFAIRAYSDYAVDLESMDVDFNEDILPWMGREIALAADPDGDVVMAVAVRNEGRAAEFLTELIDHLEDEGNEFDESEHNGVVIHKIVAKDFSTPLAFAIHDNRLLLASDSEALEDALDRAESGRGTLAGNEDYRNAMAAQPGNRIGALYISTAGLGDEIKELEALRWVSGASTLADNGTRFSYKFGFDRDRLDRRQREWLERTGSDNEMARRIPDDVLFYVASTDIGGTLDYAADVSPEFGEVMAELRREEGLGPIVRMAEEMTGEYAVAVTNQRSGMLELMTGEPYGILFAAQSGDGDDALDDLDGVFDDIKNEFFVDYDTDDIGSATIGYLSEDGIRVIGYGVDGDDVVLGTSVEQIEAAMEGDDVLSDDSAFRATMDALPDGGLGYLYFDADFIDFLVDDLVYTGESADEYSRRIEAIGLAIRPLGRNGQIDAELFFLTESPRR